MEICWTNITNNFSKISENGKNDEISRIGGSDVKESPYI